MSCDYKIVKYNKVNYETTLPQILCSIVNLSECLNIGQGLFSILYRLNEKQAYGRIGLFVLITHFS